MDQRRASQALRSRRQCVCVCVCGCLTWTRTRHRHGATLSGAVGDSRVRRLDAVAMAVCIVTRCGARAHEQGPVHGRVVGEAHGSRPTWFRVGPRHFWSRKTARHQPRGLRVRVSSVGAESPRIQLQLQGPIRTIWDSQNNYFRIRTLVS